MTDQLLSPNGTATDEDLAHATEQEIRIALEVFQQATFPSWEAKLLAGSFQRRLSLALSKE